MACFFRVFSAFFPRRGKETGKSFSSSFLLYHRIPKNGNFVHFYSTRAGRQGNCFLYSVSVEVLHRKSLSHLVPLLIITDLKKVKAGRSNLRGHVGILWGQTETAARKQELPDGIIRQYIEKTQIDQRFAGSRQEVFILIYGQSCFCKYMCAANLLLNFTAELDIL